MPPDTMTQSIKSPVTLTHSATHKAKMPPSKGAERQDMEFQDEKRELGEEERGRV